MPKETKMTEEKLALLRTLHGEGLLNGELAQRIGCSNSTITKWLQRLQLEPNTIGKRKLKRINARNEALRNQPRKVEAVIEPRTMRPAAIAGPDLLAQRIRAGLR